MKDIKETTIRICRAYRKEIAIGGLSLVALAIVVTAFFKLVGTRQDSLQVDMHTLIPDNAEAVITVNRPDVFRLMQLDNPLANRIYASELSGVFLSILRTPNIESAIISIHEQGELCCIRTTGGEVDGIVKTLNEVFRDYAPQKHTSEGIDFYFFPDTASRFFGYYIYNNVWVGSYSRKLLAKAAEQQLKGKIVPDDELKGLLKAVDRNSPASIIIPAAKANVDYSGKTERKWLSADLFVNEGSFCCHAFLPYYDDEVYYSLSAFLEDRYPELQFSYQLSGDGSEVFFTVCAETGAPAVEESAEE